MKGTWHFAQRAFFPAACWDALNLAPQDGQGRAKVTRLSSFTGESSGSRGEFPARLLRPPGRLLRLTGLAFFTLQAENGVQTQPGIWQRDERSGEEGQRRPQLGGPGPAATLSAVVNYRQGRQEPVVNVPPPDPYLSDILPLPGDY
jgi:hypothetical protein